MSKGLEALEDIMNIYGETNSLEGTYDLFLKIKKELRALDIIKNKSVDMSTFGAFETYKDYEHFYNLKFHLIENECDKLDEEEFELLKEVLEE